MFAETAAKATEYVTSQIARKNFHPLKMRNQSLPFLY